MMPSITPCLMYATDAEQAANFYVSLFEDARILATYRYSEADMQALSSIPEEHRPGPAGAVKWVKFELLGREYFACNGGPSFSFNHSVSLYVRCDSQAELDRLWQALGEGGSYQQCGWLRDRWGVPWQIAPAVIDEWMSDPDQAKIDRLSAAIYTAVKLDFETLRRAYEGAE